MAGVDAELMSAVDAIDPADMSDDDWLTAIFAMHDAGLSDEEIDAWNRRDPKRYNERSNNKRLRSAHKPTSVDIARRTIFKFANATGWRWDGPRTTPRPITATRKKGEKKPKDVPPKLDVDWLKPCAIDVLPEDMEPAEMLRRQLSAMFRPCDKVNPVTDSFWKDGKDGKPGKWDPVSAIKPDGSKFWRIADIGSITGGSNPDKILGLVNSRAGAWIRVNPCTGGGKEDVTRYASALVESDDMPPKEQLDLMLKLHLPCRSITSSAGKSIHAVVAIDARNSAEYKGRVEWLYEFCDKNGLTVDHGVGSESNLTRMAGAQRGDRIQRLVAVDTGPRSWGEFRAWVAAQENQDTADDGDGKLTLSIQRAYDATGINTPPKTPELIHGVLRRGHKLVVFGPSKASKTWLLIGCGLTLATGGKWMDRFACERSRVLLVDTEMDAASFSNRIEWVRQTWGIDPESYRDTLDVVHLRGMTLEMSQFVDLLGERGSEYDAILIDSLFSLNSGDENSAKDMKDLFSQLDRLTAEGGAVLTTHHYAKGAAGGKSAIDRGSGSGVLGRAPDAIIDMAPLVVDEDSSAWDVLRSHDYQKNDGSWIHATALRMSFVLREFASPKPIDIVFRCPVHVTDSTGELAECRVPGSAKDRGSRGGIANAERQAESYAATDKALGEIIERLHANGKTATRTNTLQSLNEWRSANGMREWSEKTYANQTRKGGGLAHRVNPTTKELFIPEPSLPPE